MDQFPSDPKKLKARVRRYERELRREYGQFGFYDDSFGKRYLLGPLYMLLGDLPGALKSFEWFEPAFPDDGGEPFHRLCWTLAVYRSGDLGTAAQKLRETMLANLYLIPHLLGVEQDTLNIWHGTNWAERDYLQYVAPEILRLWDPPALQWAQETYDSPELLQARTRTIAIFEQLKNERPGHRRSELVKEALRLKTADKQRR
jgi:hypothetical protein